MARKSYREDDIIIDLERDANPMTVGTLLDQAGYPRKSMKVLFDNKLVLLNGHKTKPQDPMDPGDQLRLQLPKEALDYEAQAMDLRVLYEDLDLLVLDKPVGITVNTAGQVSLANGVAAYFKAHGIKRKVRFLNRLDRDTSGCIVIAKSGLAQSIYQKQIESNDFKKYYQARVEGQIVASELENQPGVEMTDICNVMTKQCKTVYSLLFPMGRAADGIHREVSSEGKATRTDFELLSYDAERDQSLLQVQLFTGKTHQIRLALSHIGHPLVGDVLYGAQACESTFALRAHCIEFRHMRSGQRIRVEAK